MVNACYWAVGLDDKIDAKSDVALVGKFEPNSPGFSNYQKKIIKYKQGVKPGDLAMKGE
jgi:hypothetical protein